MVNFSSSVLKGIFYFISILKSQQQQWNVCPEITKDLIKKKYGIWNEAIKEKLKFSQFFI